MSPLFLCSVFIVTITFTLAAQNFVEVSDCPKTAEEWDMRSKKKNCLVDSLVYLCAAIENKLGRYGEICTYQRWIPENECVILNAQTHNMDSVDCKADTGCPKYLYSSSNLWRYKICYQNFYGITTTLGDKTTPTITIADARTGSLIEDGSEGINSGTWVGVATVVMIILIIVVMVVLYVRNQFGFKDNVQQRITSFIRMYFQQGDDPATAENGEAQSTDVPLLEEGKDDTKQKIKKLKELQKYLVHILKKELGVSDLKEEAVIHSKSIHEHFTKPIINGLQSIKDLNDYSQLDMSLVFALLRNFCEDIKPPSRGWDYEPPDDETHVGADIERIRYMWNKYCDNDSQFKHLDDVYNRMKQKYRTVAVHGDDSSKNEGNTESFEEVMEKIQSIKLNPDCVEKEGIVITENITTALKILESRNVVILKGAIGCGKTHALKAIQNHFQKLDKETAWVETDNLLKNMLREISTKGPTMILLCDNLFGKFGSSVFLQDVLISTEDFLKLIDSVKQNTKVVIGIHTHVYDEVKKKFNLTFLNQKHITVEMSSLSEAETLLIYKNQLKKGQCEKDSNCRFKDFQSLLDKLSQNHGHIGGPFLSLMHCFQRDLFSDDPVQTLVRYFNRMKKDSPCLFYCLVYLMCVQKHDFKEEPKKWADKINAKITKQNLTELDKTTELLQSENTIVTLAHELLTTALFKSAAESCPLFLQVLKRCKSDVIFQILRPEGSTNSALYFEYKFDPSEDSRDIQKTLANRLVEMYQQEDVDHPLMKVKTFKEKYSEYLKRNPND